MFRVKRELLTIIEHEATGAELRARRETVEEAQRWKTATNYGYTYIIIIIILNKTEARVL